MVGERHGAAGGRRRDDLGAELFCLGGRNDIVLHHMQRVVRAHLQHLGERPPGAADGAEQPALIALEDARRPEAGPGEVGGVHHRAAAIVLEPDDAEFVRLSNLVMAFGEGRQFEAAAALIADDALEIRHAGKDAKGGEMRLLFAREHPHVGAHDLLDRRHEARAVARIAHGGGREHVHFADTHQARHQGEALHGGQRAVHIGIGDAARRGEAAAQRAGGFFVVEGGQSAGMPLIDHQTHGVRADVEHRHRQGSLNAALGGGIGIDAPKFVQSLFSSVSRGKALPRPERLAWVMK